MKKITKSICLGMACIMLFFSVTACGEKTKNREIITLEDNGALITNPNMGWNFAYYSNTKTQFNQHLSKNDYLDEFPCDVIFMRIGWNYWEPEEGKYDWEYFENIMKDWWAQGKRTVLGWVVTHPGDQNTPLWVKEAGAEGKTYYWDKKVLEFTSKGPVYDEEIYNPSSQRYAPEYYLSYSEYDLNGNGILDNGEKDLNGDGYLDTTYQSGQIYTGSTSEAIDWAQNLIHDPNWNNGQEVKFELGTNDYRNLRPTWVVDYDDKIFLEKFENFLKAAAERYDDDPMVEVIDICSFGDWGEGHSAMTRSSHPTSATMKKHVDLFVKHFKNTSIVINDDAMQYGGGVLEYCMEKNVGIVDCSVSCNFSSPTDTVGNTGNTDVTDMFWKDQPIMLENHFGNPPTEALWTSVNECHASYARIHCDPSRYLQTEWADMITLRLGYRLTFTEVTVPELKMGQEAEITFRVKNTGAAPCYKGGNPTFYILDSTGKICCEAISDFDVKDLEVADTAEDAIAKTGTATMKLPKKFYENQDGIYYLAVAVTVDGEPIYNLPLDNADENGRKLYKIGTFKIGEVF
ncbi:MAG: DUF4832 domain-containing protein [Tyzzerella sp.]|nr:DUF4832 domain-containing protein [Tyzzerella sp.]